VRVDAIRGPTAYLIAAALVAADTLGALWLAPAASATDRGTHPTHGTHRIQRGHPAASASPASGPRVKYFIVPPSRHGHQEFLYEIAAETLGDGNRYREIFNLNQGRLQPDGAQLKVATAIDSGWILELPPNASGPGVHFGPLPVVQPKSAKPVRRSAVPVPPHRTSGPVASGARASNFRSRQLSTGGATGSARFSSP
jgi:hypothetical protein